ncbi:hypothetical protein BB561_005029 [Smittium simulii]|uniref:Required for respiratory growth protein 9, mitochondrial n=1 Tax=Smittium simulii TaxID=133385 RepID=A0A2T9YCM7_9FUNG|nr:hypothetical protein BB561_005029 [Smittium simulii]
MEHIISRNPNKIKSLLDSPEKLQEFRLSVSAASTEKSPINISKHSSYLPRPDKSSSAAAVFFSNKNTNTAPTLLSQGKNTPQKTTSNGPSASSGYQVIGSDIKALKEATAAKNLKANNLHNKGLKKSEADEDLYQKGLLYGWKKKKLEISIATKGEKWNPEKKVSRATMIKIKFLFNEMPDVFTVAKISQEYKISRVAVQKILRSRFQPSEKQHIVQERNKKAQKSAFLKSKYPNSDNVSKSTTGFDRSSPASDSILFSLSDTLGQSNKNFSNDHNSYKKKTRF